VGLQWGLLGLVSTTEELLGRNSSGSGGDPLRWPRDTLYPQKLALTSPTGGGRSFGIVRLWTKTTEFVLFVFKSLQCWDIGSVQMFLFARGIDFPPSV
jgi:hypothetical protein